MAHRTLGPRRSESPRAYLRATWIVGGLSLLVLAGAVAWDLADDGFWARHPCWRVSSRARSWSS